MSDKKQVDKWLEDGTITQEQANTMLSDVKDKGVEEGSNKFITAISTIGAILIVGGAVLLISTQWDGIAAILKTIILVVSTVGAYAIGFYLKERKPNLPKTGASILFLSTLLFGASLFLITSAYNIGVEEHILMLIWLLGTLPLVYIFKSDQIAVLSGLLLSAWFVTLLLNDSEAPPTVVPVVFIAAGALLFGAGGLHYLFPSLKKVARNFRLVGIKTAILALFLLTFKMFSTLEHNSYFFKSSIADIDGRFLAWMSLLSVLAIVALIANLVMNPSKSKSNKAENGAALVLVVTALLFFFFPTNSFVYQLIFNILFIVVSVLMVYIGYQRADIKVVNIAVFWIALFIAARYIDFFWDSLDKSVFFIGAGLIFIGGGVILEKKRRGLKATFKKKK